VAEPAVPFEKILMLVVAAAELDTAAPVGVSDAVPRSPPQVMR